MQLSETLMDDIEKEAEAEGPEAVAQLSAFKQRFAVGLPRLGGKTAAVRSLERNTIQSIHLSPSGNLTILYQDGSTHTIGDQIHLLTKLSKDIREDTPQK